MGLKIGIYGIGAIGSLLATRLTKSQSLNPNLKLIIKPQHKPAILQTGLAILSPIDLYQKKHVSVTESSLLCPQDPSFHTIFQPLDIVIIAVKSCASHQIGAQLHDMLHKWNWITDDTLIITLQNGIGNKEVLLNHFQDRSLTVLQGLTYMGGFCKSRGQVVEGGPGATFIENPSNVQHQMKLKQLQSLFLDAEMDCTIASTESITTLVWKKFMINAVINPLASILDRSNKAVLSSESSKSIARQVISEVLMVAKAKKIEIYGDDVEVALKEVERVAKVTGDNICSMLSDLRMNNPTEIASINQKVVEYGNEVAIATPYNELMTLLIKSMETRSPEKAPTESKSN